MRSALTSVLVGGVYLVTATLALKLASINPSATPIWPPTGLALAAVLLWGYRVLPAIYVAALIANLVTAGSIYTSTFIAFGNTAECLVGAYLIIRWSGGTATFDTPLGVAKFALISLAAATPISATVGVATLVSADYADAAQSPLIWTTWWLGDLAGAVVVAPAIVLWTIAHPLAYNRKERWASAATLGVATFIGIIAFSPLVAESAVKNALGFLSVVPLLWAALRGSRADTATAILILAAFAVWGTTAQVGPFAHNSQNDSFLLLLMFMMSVSVPSLILSADVGVRRRAEQHQKLLTAELDHRVKNTLASAQAIAALTLRSSPSPEAFNTAFLARLRAMARNHELLARSGWTGVPIEQIVSDTLEPYADAGDRIVVAGPHLMLNAAIASPIGMVIHELVTNAAKHGALSALSGRVGLEWRDDAGFLDICWTESDGPSVQAPDRRGLGLRLIEHSLDGLGGQVSAEFKSQGLVCKIRLPLGRPK